MAYATQTAVSNGSLTILNVAIEYMYRSEITVYFDDARQYSGWHWADNNAATIIFDSPVPNGTVVKLRRSTNVAEPFHTFSEGAMFDKANMDDNFKQMLHVAQEMQEDGGILVPGPGGSGEANTTSNLGTGVGIAAPKSGVNLPMKSLRAGANITITSDANEVIIAAETGVGGSGSGTVTSVSVAAANGFAGTVANATTTPAISIGTSVTNGMVKSAAGGLAAAVAGTDYVAPGAVTSSGITAGTNKLLGRSSAGTGAVEEVSIGSGLTLSSGTLSASGGTSSPLKLITEFGAVPNIGVDNTAAFQAAMDWIVANKRPVFIPAGQWLTQAITLYTGSNQDWCGFVGEDPKTTIVAYYGTTPANTAMITVGSPSMTTYIGNLRFANITFQANGSNTNATSFRIYDLAWTTFDNCNFQGGDVAFDCLGGVNVTFEQCGFQYAASTGLRIDKFTRAGGGWPNNIKVIGGVAGANSKRGIYFDYGRQLILDGVQIEGNGTTAGSADQGGLIVGTNIGAETGTQATNAHFGVVGCNIWFEQNTGIADAYLQSGLNTLTGCLFWSQPSIVTNNVRITGQKYSLVNCDFSQTSFTVGQPNVFEGASVLAGNTVIGGDVPKISWNNQKTTLLIDNAMFSPAATFAGPISGASTITAGTNITASGTVQGANVTATSTVTGVNVVATSAVSGATVDASTNASTRSLNIGPLWNALLGTTPTKPVILFGFDQSSGTPTISFGKTMANNGTVIIVQPIGVPDSLLRSPIVTSVTTTGFAISKDRISGTLKTTENYGVYWIAIGQEA